MQDNFIWQIGAPAPLWVNKNLYIHIAKWY